MKLLKPGLFLMLGLLWAWIAASDVYAQSVTVETLLGSEEVGPHIQDVEDAIKRFQQRDIEGARRLLEAARSKTPAIGPAETLLAQLYFAAGQRTQARAELEKAIQKNPQDPEPYVILADVAFAEGRVTEAGLLYDKATEIATAYNENAKRKRQLLVRGHAGSAAVLETHNKWDDARKHIEAWIKLEPDKSNPHQRLARAYFKLNDKQKAYDELKLAAKADPKMPAPEIVMANFLTQAQEPGNAQKWIEAAQRRNDVATKTEVARLLLQSNKYKEAADQAEQAVRLDPNNANAHIVAGMAYRMQGNFKQAQKHFETAHLIAPSNANAINQLALTLVEMPDEESRKRAEDFAELNARANPKSGDGLATLGWVQYKLGRQSEATRNLMSSTTMGNMNPESYYFVANILRDEGRTADAAKLLDTVLSADAPFAYRKQANLLRDKLKKDLPR